MKSLLLPATIFLAFATAGLAQPESSGGADATNRVQPKASEKSAERICRLVRDPDSGSLIRGRAERCLTAEQWRALNRR